MPEKILKIPELDRLLEKHNTDHVKIICVNNTPEEKIQLKELDERLDKEITYVNYIIKQVLECLEARGINTSEYI
tara:strand:- start:2092 stop:2316 length:225 start_codon:yes stop_codon:yes gene_type:complete